MKQRNKKRKPKRELKQPDKEHEQNLDFDYSNSDDDIAASFEYLSGGGEPNSDLDYLRNEYGLEYNYEDADDEYAAPFGLDEIEKRLKSLRFCEKLEKIIVRTMIFVVPALMILVHIISGQIMKRMDIAATRNAYENLPWRQVFVLSKDKLEVLRRGEFSEQELNTAGLRVMADFISGELRFDELNLTKSLPEQEITALDYLYNSPDMPIKFDCISASNNFSAHLDHRTAEGRTYIDFEYGEPYINSTRHSIVKDIGGGYAVTISASPEKKWGIAHVRGACGTVGVSAIVILAIAWLIVCIRGAMLSTR